MLRTGPSGACLPRQPLSRRDVLKLTGGAGVAAGGLLLPRSARAEEPKSGGTLTIGMSYGSTASSLDPVTYTNFNDYCIGFALGNCLVELDANKNPLPELAESWESSDAAKRWAFKIRPGVEFNNGKTLTAADAAWSLNRHISEDSKSAAKGLLAGVTAIRADGDNVIIEHDTGNADMPIILAQFHMLIVPEGHSDWSSFVGTGGYLLDYHEPGVSFSANRNPNYWKQDRGWLDRIEITTVADATARTNALLTGEMMGVDRIDPKVMDMVKQRDVFDIVESVGTRYLTTAMNVQQAPFDDPDVRLALKYAIDRDEIRNKVFRGYGVIGNDHPVPPNDPYVNAALPQRAYDPEKARWHLKKAGHDTLAVRLHGADAAFVGSVDAAVLMSAAAEGSGIDIEVVREPNDGYWSNVWMKKPYVMSTWTVRPTPAIMFSIAFACEAPWNETFWCNGTFAKLLVASKTETDFDKRKALFAEMQQIVHDDGGNGVYFFPSEIDVYDRTVAGVEPDAMGPFQGGRIAERAWLRS